MSILPTPIDVADFFAKNVDTEVQDESQRADPTVYTPYQELAKVLKRVGPISTTDAAADKLLTMIQVVNRSLVPALIMTPYVYITATDWVLKSHATFRSSQRKELKELEDILKANLSSTDRKTIATDVLNRFELVLINIFNVRIPAMPSFYLTENFYDTISVGDACEDLILKINQCKKYDLRERTRNLTKVLIQWFLYCPIGRPQVYANDEGWATVSEKELRSQFRDDILN